MTVLITTTTTTAATNNMAMLFLRRETAPRLIDMMGELSTSFDFYGQEVYGSCGVTFQNKQFIFGGTSDMRQILKLNDCGLISIGLTPFNNYLSACGSTNEKVILCFNTSRSTDYKRCRQASSPSGPWTQMALSMYEHRQTSWRGQ